MKKLIIITQLLMLALALPVQAQNKNFRKDFEDFKNKARREYSDFRRRHSLSMPSLSVRHGRSSVPSLR